MSGNIVHVAIGVDRAFGIFKVYVIRTRKIRMDDYIKQLKKREKQLDAIAQELRINILEHDKNFIGSIELSDAKDPRKRLEESIDILENTIKKWWDYYDNISMSWKSLACIAGLQIAKDDIKPTSAGIAWFLRYTYSGAPTSGAQVNYVGLTINKEEVYFDGSWTPQKAYDKIWQIAEKTDYKLPIVPKSHKIELIRMMYTQCVKCSSSIARDTRRGAGNILIVSESLRKDIIQLEDFKNDRGAAKSLPQIGTLHRFKVFLDSQIKGKEALVAYQGDKTTDCGTAIVQIKNTYTFGFDQYSSNYYRRIVFI